MTQEEGG